MRCYRAVADGVVVTVRLTPKAARDSLDGVGLLADGSEAAIARVRAPPAEGAANAALVSVLARALRIPKRAVSIVGGAGGRLKRVHVAGDATSLSRTIEQWPRLS